MQTTPDFYDFCGVRLFVADLHIELLESGKEHIPSPIHRSFLLAMLRKFPAVVSYEELWREVWRSKLDMSETDLRNIQTTKGQLALWFKDKIQRNLPIEADPGKGYRLNCDVTPGWTEIETELFVRDNFSKTNANSTGDSADLQFQTEISDKKDNSQNLLQWRELFYSHLKYVILAGSFYGFLFFIAAILEVAYKFDKYGKNAVIFGIIFMVINSAAVFTSLATICRRLCNEKPAFSISVTILVCSGILTILLSASFLPLTPITEAQIQTQPAIIAFGKNVLIYFVPLGIIFLLITFYGSVAGSLCDKNFIRTMPSDVILIKSWQLLLIYIGAIIFSLLTTNHLLENLRADNYHALFTGLILLRFVVYFGLGLGLIIWHYTQINNKNVQKPSL